jgi:transposase
MSELKKIKRLLDGNIPIKEIARVTGVSRNTIKKYMKLGVNDPQDNSKANSLLLTADSTSYQGAKHDQLVDHFKINESELKRTGVTRKLLWEEYKQLYADGYEYSQYCYHFTDYLKHKEVVMHLDHVCGEELMVDFTGKKMSYINEDGHVVNCPVYLSVLPFSGMPYCKAVHHQGTYDFADAFVSMVYYYHGLPKVVITDNLKAAIKKSSKYEPVLSELCDQLSDHYQVCITATRPYKPRDKAMVERYVRIIYTEVFAPLRNDRFKSIEEVNRAILVRLEILANKKYANSSYTRKKLFIEVEQPTLKALPAFPFELKKVRWAQVQRNYHVQLSENHHYYSVPYIHTGRKVKVLYDSNTVEIYYEGQRIALHAYASQAIKSYHTHKEHMPPNHAQAMQYKGWTKEYMMNQAEIIGPYTRQAIDHILQSGFHLAQNFKSCYGVFMLKKMYDPQRIENACRRAVKGTRIGYGIIKTILEKNLDKAPDLESASTPTLWEHDNLRGSTTYY